jgi:arsenate reductase-like glutaredoxin family protein
MQVTEHNITEWKLTDDEIQEIIRLLKLEMKECQETDRATYMYYGMMIGKLVIMKNERTNETNTSTSTN